MRHACTGWFRPKYRWLVPCSHSWYYATAAPAQSSSPSPDATQAPVGSAQACGADSNLEQIEYAACKVHTCMVKSWVQLGPLGEQNGESLCRQTAIPRGGPNGRLFQTRPVHARCAHPTCSPIARLYWILSIGRKRLERLTPLASWPVLHQHCASLRLPLYTGKKAGSII